MILPRSSEATSSAIFGNRSSWSGRLAAVGVGRRFGEAIRVARFLFRTRSGIDCTA
jgi:hypothetical protein